MNKWNQALTAALGVIPGGNTCDPQEIADSIRALMKDESPRAAAFGNIGRTGLTGNQKVRIVGVRTDQKKGTLCYVVHGPFGTSELPVEKVEVVLC